jgi:hypothetical protein
MEGFSVIGKAISHYQITEIPDKEEWAKSTGLTTRTFI